jgi:peroxiredoxin (alkyl hydroperoxide reductase subunit C)
MASSSETSEATGEQVGSPRIPLIGEPAPAFEAVTTQGPIRFPEDFQGKWVILFSHPADFTPVCTTEFMTFASLMPQFEALGCKLIGLSIDSNYSHIAWLRTIKEKIKYKGMEGVEVTFPVIADLKMDVARKYGMVQPSADDSHAVRAVFIIDGEGKVRAVLYYPISTGRYFPEILRLLVALQTADKLKVATPADWQPGDDVIVPPPGSCGTAQERIEGKESGMKCLDWFLCLKEVPKEQLDLPPTWK